MQTIATVIDTILNGNILSSLDILSQRFKSLELLATGTSADVIDFAGRRQEYAAETKLQQALKGGKGKVDLPRAETKCNSKGFPKLSGLLFRPSMGNQVPFQSPADSIGQRKAW